MIEAAQDRAYDLAHNAIVAATEGDTAGVDALCKVFRIELETILKAVRKQSQDTV